MLNTPKTSGKKSGRKGLLIAAVVILALVLISVILLMLSNAGIVNIFGKYLIITDATKNSVLESQVYDFKLNYSNYWKLVDHNTHDVTAESYNQSAERFVFSDQTGKVTFEIMINTQGGDGGDKQIDLKINGKTHTFYRSINSDGSIYYWTYGESLELLGSKITGVEAVQVTLNIDPSYNEDNAVAQMVKMLDAVTIK